MQGPPLARREFLPPRRPRQAADDAVLRIGTVLSRALRIWTRRFVRATAPALALASPLAVGLFCVPDFATAQAVHPYGSAVLARVSACALAALVAPGVAKELDRDARETHHAVAPTRRPLGAIASASLVAGIATSLPFGLARAMLPKAVPVAVAAAVGGFLLLSRYWLAAPVAALEGHGGIEALRRSEFLTVGVRLRVFWLVVILGLITACAQAGVYLVAWGFILPGAGTEPDPLRWHVVELIEIIVQAVMSGLSAVAVVVVYHDRHRAKDAPDPDRVADVFA